jgi:hypothetical protein
MADRSVRELPGLFQHGSSFVYNEGHSNAPLMYLRGVQQCFFPGEGRCWQILAHHVREGMYRGHRVPHPRWGPVEDSM